jgi:hypothetical protein
MSDNTVKVDPQRPITAKMSFIGIANHYEAHLYVPSDGPNQWKRIRTLESDGSSDDARPDEFTFDPPPSGRTLLFFFQSPMTAAAVPSDIKVTARIEQGGQTVGTASASGTVETFVDVVLRVQLEAA